MTTNPLALADACFVAAGLLPSEAALERQAVGQAAALLRTQHEAIERKDALLKQALDALCMPCDRWNKTQSQIIRGVVDAITKELQ